MATNQPDILYFGPTDASTTPIANHAACFAAHLANTDGLHVTNVFDRSAAENLENFEGAVSLVRKRTLAVLREQSRRFGGQRVFPNQIIHGEIGRRTYREFWGVHFASRHRPEAPVCLVFHDPPVLTQPIRPGEAQGKRNFFERAISNMTRRMAHMGQANVEEAFLRRASVFLTFSRLGANLLADRYPRHRHKIGLLPAMALGEIPLDLRQANEKMRTHITITVFGFIRPDRALDDVIDAMVLVHKKTPLIGKAVVRIRGRMPYDLFEAGYADRIQERNRKLGIQWLVDFKPGALRETQVDQLLRETDILIIPHREGASANGVSRTLMRAGAWGTAVVATDVGSIGEFIDHGKNGLICAPGDIYGMAELVGALIADKEYRKRLADSMREKILGDHTPRKVCRLMTSLYHELLAARTENRPVVFPEDMRVFEPAEVSTAGAQGVAAAAGGSAE